MRRVRRLLARITAGLALGLCTVVGISAGTLVPAIPPPAAHAADPEVAEATASWLRTNVLPINAVNTAYTEMAYTPGGVNAATDTLNVSVLNGLLPLSLGDAEIHLIKDPTKPTQVGLLELGELGVLQSHSATPTALRAHAASGLLGADGALQLSQYDSPNLENSRLDLAALLTQVLGPSANTIFSEAGISIGAVGSEISAGNTALNGVELCTFEAESQYVLTDLGLNLTSPLVAGLATDITQPGGILESTVLGTLNGLVGQGGLITTAVDGAVGTVVDLLDGASILGLGVNASSAGTEVVLDTAPIVNGVSGVLAAEISDSEGDVHLSVTDGSIRVDLDDYAVKYAQSQNPSASYTLNTLPANTPALDSTTTVNPILDGVTSILDGSSANPNSLSSVLRQNLMTGIYESSLTVKIGIDLEVCVLLCTSLLDLPVTVSGKIGQWMGKPGYAAPTIDLDDLAVLGLPLGWLTTLLTPTLTGLVTTVGSILTSTIDDPNTGILAGFQAAVFGPGGPVTALLNALLSPSGYLRTLLDTVATVTINRQPEVGDLGAGSRTVRALEVALLPDLGDTGFVSVQLASSTADAPTAICLTLTKILQQTSQFAWATNALPGDWRLSAAHAAASVNGATGTAAVTGVPVPPGTLTLTEEIPSGVATGGLSASAYQNEWVCTGPDDAPVAVTQSPALPGSYRTGSVLVAEPPGDTVASLTCGATNTLTTATAAWNKVVAGAPSQLLGGSEWIIERTSAPAASVAVGLANSATDPGEFAVGGLPPGAYQLTETVAPLGFVRLTDPIDFEVGVDGVITGLPSTVENRVVPLPSIPLTGGVSAQHFVVFGAALGLLAVFAAWRVSRRQRQSSSFCHRERDPDVAP